MTSTFSLPLSFSRDSRASEILFLVENQTGDSGHKNRRHIKQMRGKIKVEKTASLHGNKAPKISDKAKPAV